MNYLANQIDMSALDASRGINAFRQGEQDQIQQNQRNLLKEVGGQAATGNYLEAAQTAMKGGDVSTGMELNKYKSQLDASDTDKRLKLLDFFGRGAGTADTQEKWDTLLNMAQGVYGRDIDLSAYKDFNSRQQVMQFLANTKEQLEREKLKAQTDLYRAQAQGVGQRADTPQSRMMYAQQYGLDPNSDAGRAYILTGKLPREDQQALTATDKKAILEADEMVSANRAAITALGEAGKLSPKANQGWFAGTRAAIGNNLPDVLVPDFISSPESSEATANLDNAVVGQALAQLKTIFGGNPTEGERKILLDLQGSAAQPHAVRMEIFRRAREAAEKRLQFNEERASGLRGGQYYKPEGAPQLQPQERQSIDLGDGFTVEFD